MKIRYGKLTPVKPVGASQYRFRCDCKQEFVFPAGLDDYHCPCDLPKVAETVGQVMDGVEEFIAKPKRRGRPRKAE